VKLTW
jgi:hypothetical protein